MLNGLVSIAPEHLAPWMKDGPMDDSVPRSSTNTYGIHWCRSRATRLAIRRGRVAPANRRRNRLGHIQFGNTESKKWYTARGEPSQVVLLAIFFTFKQHLFDWLSSRIQFHRDIAAAEHARKRKVLCTGYISDQILALARLVLATHC